MPNKSIAIIGAGPAGLMAAEVLSQYGHAVHVFEQKPSAARKFLMAGKTGLNISHAETIDWFVQRYDQAAWLAPWLEQWNADWIQRWMRGLGIASYTGSSGRIFPVGMKAAPLLRAWLRRLTAQGVQFYYRHQVVAIEQQSVQVYDLKMEQQHSRSFDAIVLACGGVSWPQLGSDGAWQAWLAAAELEPFQASNVGVLKQWSDFMQPVFGQPLKRVAGWVDERDKSIGDIVISHYGLESGLIYKQNRALRELIRHRQPMQIYLDLLPDLSLEQLTGKLQASKKQSLSNCWRKAGLDTAKASLVRELVDKSFWNNAEAVAKQVKQLRIELEGFRPIEEAISCSGGVRREALTTELQLKSCPYIFCCGEMLNWDAPTGGYLLTACLATGRAAAEGVHHYLLISTE
ncbi:TIGR03862 family flavoprotein [Acinetobacter sp. WZC-1]|uniref:TIGR03862 family flavoprotein n=1 Tax=Acinetobacter sp. WZC-1 TaxID=3459034 RepID=UPI00403DE9B7